MLQGDTMERLELKIDGLKEMLIEHQRRNDEQFAQFEKYFNLKIETDTCNSCSVSARVEKIEVKTQSLIEWRIYTVALISIIVVFLPHILDKLFT